MNLTDQILQGFTERARADSALIQAGVKAAELRVSPALRNLAACYRKALKNGETKIPTYLHAAIEAAVRLTPDEAPKAGAELT